MQGKIATEPNQFLLDTSVLDCAGQESCWAVTVLGTE